jgi:4-hydroxybenzoate polyprenyltransferase
MLIGLIKLTRPIHWVKNLSIFAAIVFSGGLFDQKLMLAVFEAFLVFNIAASATYVFNDLIDVKRDRLHPIKKKRPIASGAVPASLALIMAIGLVAIALTLAYLLSEIFFLLIVTYFLMQSAYSLYLKNVHIVDILIIAAGVVIRVYAGAFVIDAHLSVWFLLCVLSVALFLASGKRRAELRVVDDPQKTRKSLSKYSKELLNSYVTMFGNAAWMSWALFTFFESPRLTVPLWLVLAEFSQTTSVNKLLMVTIPVSIFGIMRYQSLIFEGRSESPEKLLLTDLGLVTSVLLWVSMVVWILYGGLSVA